MSRPTPPWPSRAWHWPSRAWRYCATCWGVCYWHNQIKAWLCRDCGSVWYPDHDSERYGPPAHDDHPTRWSWARPRGNQFPASAGTG
jgi:hypothetical protein